MLDSALKYRDLGYAIFPVVHGGKVPLIAGGCNSATTDENQIRDWWARWPTANIGLATTGLLVVDIDGPDNAWWTPERAYEFAAAPQSVTPRGGRHIIFRQPAGKEWRNTASRLAPNVDTRGWHGYILVAPSVVGGKPYAWVEGCELDFAAGDLPEPPAWLCELLDSGAEQVKLTEEDGLVGKIGEGQRDNQIARIAGYMRRIGLTKNEILPSLHAANEERCRPPLAVKDVDRIAASITRYEPDQVWQATIEGWWEELQQAPDFKLPAGPKDPGPFPEHLLYPPGFIGEIVNYIVETAHRPQPVLALAAALAALGTLTGRKIRDSINTRTNIYVVGVAGSGMGKDHPRQVIKELFFLAGAERLAGPEGLASHAGLISAIEVQPSILFQLDEVGRIMKTISDPGSPHLFNIATNLMKLYTSAGGVYMGDAYADSKRNKTIYQPCACVYGTTVPQSFFESLTFENVSDGLLARMLIFEADENAPKRRPAGGQLNVKHIEFAKEWFAFLPSGNLSSENPVPITVPEDDDAKAVLIAFDEEAEFERKAQQGPLATLWTRAAEKANKLAMLHAASRGLKGLRTDLAASQWACDLSRHLTRRLVFLASQWCAEGAYDAKRKKLLRIIADAGAGGLSKTELSAKTKSMPTKDRVELLEALKACGDVNEVAEDSGGRGPKGRRYIATHLLN